MGVEVRWGLLASFRLPWDKDVPMLAVAGRLRSLVGSGSSPHSEPPRAPPGKTVLGRNLLARHVPRIGLMSAMVTGKGFVAG